MCINHKQEQFDCSGVPEGGNLSMRIWYVAYVVAELWNRFRECSFGWKLDFLTLRRILLVFFFFNFSWGCSLDGVFCLSIMPLCIVLALPQMILIISWLLGKKCGPVDSQFPIFHWFEWLFIGPVWEAQHSLFRRTYSLVKFFQPFWKIQGSRCYLHGRSFWHDHYIWLCCCIDCFASLWLSRGSKYQGSYR